MALIINLRHLEGRDLHLEGKIAAEELDLAGLDELIRPRFVAPGPAVIADRVPLCPLFRAIPPGTRAGELVFFAGLGGGRCSAG
jgi:hypothetical protein